MMKYLFALALTVATSHLYSQSAHTQLKEKIVILDAYLEHLYGSENPFDDVGRVILKTIARYDEYSTEARLSGKTDSALHALEIHKCLLETEECITTLLSKIEAEKDILSELKKTIVSAYKGYEYTQLNNNAYPLRSAERNTDTSTRDFGIFSAFAGAAALKTVFAAVGGLIGLAIIYKVFKSIRNFFQRKSRSQTKHIKSIGKNLKRTEKDMESFLRDEVISYWKRKCSAPRVAWRRFKRSFLRNVCGKKSQSWANVFSAKARKVQKSK